MLALCICIYALFVVLEKRFDSPGKVLETFVGKSVGTLSFVLLVSISLNFLL